MEIVLHLNVFEYSVIQQTIKKDNFELYDKKSSQILTIHGLSRKLYKAFIEFTPGKDPYCIPRMIFVQSTLTSLIYCRTSTKSGRNDLFLSK